MSGISDVGDDGYDDDGDDGDDDDDDDDDDDVDYNNNDDDNNNMIMEKIKLCMSPIISIRFNNYHFLFFIYFHLYICMYKRSIA